MRISRGGADPVVITVVGEIDADNADELAARLRAAMPAGAKVVIDLAGVGFLDSSGLRTLLVARQWATTNGGSLGLRAPSRPALRTLTVSGLLEAFELSPAESST